MSLVNVIAEFSCDGCGAIFRCSLDEETPHASGASITDIANEACAEGLHLEADLNPVSFVDDQNLCPKCTETYGDRDKTGRESTEDDED
jgi:predicted RNA-binding Zn-ribbon protein involved in translation (DUF1610 family)